MVWNSVQPFMNHMALWRSAKFEKRKGVEAVLAHLAHEHLVLGAGAAIGAFAGMWNCAPAPWLETTPLLMPKRPETRPMREGRQGESAQ